MGKELGYRMIAHSAVSHFGRDVKNYDVDVDMPFSCRSGLFYLSLLRHELNSRVSILEADRDITQEKNKSMQYQSRFEHLKQVKKKQLDCHWIPRLRRVLRCHLPSPRMRRAGTSRVKSKTCGKYFITLNNW